MKIVSEAQKQTFVEFFTGGAFMSESSVKPVEDREVESLSIPRWAYGFQYFDVVTATVMVDGTEVKLKSERINVSPMHYVGGEVMTLKKIATTVPNSDILVANLKSHRVTRGIRTRLGNWQPFEKGDINIPVPASQPS
jgi:hypothetical protein